MCRGLKNKNQRFFDGRIIFLIITVMFFLQSCSWVTYFYVLNRSNEQIVVTFKHPKKPETTPYLEKIKSEKPELYKKLKPTPCPIEKDIIQGNYPEICDEDLENCRVLNSEEYKFDRERCSIEVILKKNKSVKLFSICCSYSGIKDDDEDNKTKEKPVEEMIKDERMIRDDIYALTIKSPSGLLHYEESGLLRAFKKKEKTKYVLEHK